MEHGLIEVALPEGAELSQASIKEKLQGELDELESELRIHLPKEIKRALEFGDLRENSEYRAARPAERCKGPDCRLAATHREIASIDPNKVPRDKASTGRPSYCSTPRKTRKSPIVW